MTARSTMHAAVVIGVILVGAQPLAAQQADTFPTIDPLAINALKKMGEYLMRLDEFQVKANITSEQVLRDSSKVQLSKNADLLVDRPNKLRLQVLGDQHERIFLYDGSTFTLWAPLLRFYGTVPAPATLAELARKLEDEHGIDLPLVDLFRWGTQEAQISQITAAKNIGVSNCEGVTCQHYAFRQPGVDWQVWIQRGDHPLPRRLVITTRTDEARPQYAATYSWNLAPSFNDKVFAFDAPEDAKKIPLATVRSQTNTAISGKSK